MMIDARLLIIGVGEALAFGVGAWAVVYYATYAVRSQVLGQTIWRGNTERALVALTFDDGPSPDTPVVLDVLKAHNLKATFFMIGQAVEQFPQVARRIVAEGHEIGNHSYSHPIYLFRTAGETSRQLEQAQGVLEQTTGVRPSLSRPPCGVRTRAYFGATQRLGLRTVQWDVAGFDWKQLSAEQIADNVLKGAQAGSIILLHDGDSTNKHDRRQTIAALPRIIEGLSTRGLRIAPLAEVLEGVN